MKVRTIGGKFESWYAGCALHAIQEGIAPDDYVWDLKNNAEWRHLYNRGVDIENACDIVFFDHIMASGELNGKEIDYALYK
jgi:hypothetical protein